MNSLPKFCPNCTNYPTLLMSRTKINIKCKCGYDKVISIKDYLNQLKDSHSKLVEITKEINIDVQERTDYLNFFSIDYRCKEIDMDDHQRRNFLNDVLRDYCCCSYQCNTNTKLAEITIDINSNFFNFIGRLKDIKQNLMTQLIKQLNDLESSYEKCITENTAIFCLLQILIDNYNDSKEMETNIVLNSNIQYCYCKNNDSVEDVINYFKTYSIIEATYKDPSFDPVKDITITKTFPRESIISSVIVLQDKRVAVSCREGNIIVYNPQKDFSIDITINYPKDTSIASICQLDNGVIASMSDELNNIKLFSINGNTYQELHTFLYQKDVCGGWFCFPKITALSNNRIAASMRFAEGISIFDGNAPYKSQKPIIILIDESSVKSLLYIKEKELLVSVTDTITFWNVNTFQKVAMLSKGVVKIKSLFQFDNDLLLAFTYNSAKIIDMNKLEIKDTINELKDIYSVMKLRNGTLLLSNRDGEHYLFDIKKKELYELLSLPKEKIIDFIPLGDSSFITYSNDSEYVMKLLQY